MTPLLLLLLLFNNINRRGLGRDVSGLRESRQLLLLLLLLSCCCRSAVGLITAV